MLCVLKVLDYNIDDLMGTNFFQNNYSKCANVSQKKADYPPSFVNRLVQNCYSTSISPVLFKVLEVDNVHICT